MQEAYPTDLTEGQWQLIEPLLPKPKKVPGGPGRPANDLRTMVNAVFYPVKSGCQWANVAESLWTVEDRVRLF